MLAQTDVMAAGRAEDLVATDEPDATYALAVELGRIFLEQRSPPSDLQETFKTPWSDALTESLTGSTLRSITRAWRLSLSLRTPHFAVTTANEFLNWEYDLFAVVSLFQREAQQRRLTPANDFGGLYWKLLTKYEEHNSDLAYSAVGYRLLKFAWPEPLNSLRAYWSATEPTVWLWNPVQEVESVTS